MAAVPQPELRRYADAFAAPTPPTTAIWMRANGKMPEDPVPSRAGNVDSCKARCTRRQDDASAQWRRKDR